MDITFKMINIPMPDDPDRREAIFGDADIDFENETVFSRTFTVSASGIDYSSRNAFLVNPHEVEVVIDYNTMRAPVSLEGQAHQGVHYEFSEPNPQVLTDHRTWVESETWVDYNPELFGLIPFMYPVNSIDLRSQSDGRRLHIAETNEDGTPLFSLPQQQVWNQQRRDYVDDNMVSERNDRLPYHNPLLHIEGPHRQGQNVPPLIIRRPSNHSLLDLLPEPVRNYRPPVPPQRIPVPINQVNLGPDEGGAGAPAPGPVIPPAVRPFLPPNPYAIAHQEQVNRQQFDNWRADLVTRIHRDEDRRNLPFNMETNHAIQNNNLRLARRQRRDERIRAAEEELANYPPAGQPDEDDPPVNFGGVEMDFAGNALVALQVHGQPIPNEVYGIHEDEDQPAGIDPDDIEMNNDI